MKKKTILIIVGVIVLLIAGILFVKSCKYRLVIYDTKIEGRDIKHYSHQIDYYALSNKKAINKANITLATERANCLINYQRLTKDQLKNLPTIPQAYILYGTDEELPVAGTDKNYKIGIDYLEYDSLSKFAVTKIMEVSK